MLEIMYIEATIMQITLSVGKWTVANRSGRIVAQNLTHRVDDRINIPIGI